MKSLGALLDSYVDEKMSVLAALLNFAALAKLKGPDFENEPDQLSIPVVVENAKGAALVADAVDDDDDDDANADESDFVDDDEDDEEEVDVREH